MPDGHDSNSVTGAGGLTFCDHGSSNYGMAAVPGLHEVELVDGCGQGFGELMCSNDWSHRRTWRQVLPPGTGETLLPSVFEYLKPFEQSRWIRAVPEFGLRQGITVSGPSVRNLEGLKRSDAGAKTPLLHAAKRGADVELTLYTDSKRYRAETGGQFSCDLSYVHRITKRGVKVSLANRTLVDILNGKSRIDFSSYCREYGAMPVYLIMDITNQSSGTISFRRALLDVDSSLARMRPLPVVVGSGTHVGDEDCPIRLESLDDRVVIDNYGWGAIEDATISFRFSAGDGSRDEGSKAINVALGDFQDYQTISVFSVLREMGVATDRLRLDGPAPSGPSTLTCSTWQDIRECTQGLARSGIFGDLSKHIYGRDNLVVTNMVGDFRYEWVDARGVRQRGRGPFAVIVPVYGFDIPATFACGAGGATSYAERVVELPVNRRHYRVNVDIPAQARVLGPRQNARIGINIDSPQSATHHLSVVLETSTGRRIRSLPVEIDIFKLRTEKTYAKTIGDRHLRISVPPPDER
ncbi:MAG: hypothetical protein ACK2UO_13055 [Caldilineaceae bacterium]